MNDSKGTEGYILLSLYYQHHIITAADIWWSAVVVFHRIRLKQHTAYTIYIMYLCILIMIIVIVCFHSAAATYVVDW